METFIVLIEFFGGLILFFGFGYLIGHLLKLKTYIEEDKKKVNPNLSALKKRLKK